MNPANVEGNIIAKSLNMGGPSVNGANGGEVHVFPFSAELSCGPQPTPTPSPTEPPPRPSQAPSPSPSQTQSEGPMPLPVTGRAVLPLVITGGILLTGGVAALVLGRQRKRRLR